MTSTGGAATRRLTEEPRCIREVNDDNDSDLCTLNEMPRENAYDRFRDKFTD